MIKEILIFSLCIATVYCGLAQERASVTAEEKARGYACKSSNEVLGLMKEGEVRKNYVPEFCSQASCNGGVVYYESCGTMSVEGCNAKPDPKKPYPRCCVEFICV